MRRQASIFDADLGSQLRDQGMQEAIDHAEDRVDANWGEKAYNKLKEYLKAFPRQFMAEEVRRYADAAGLPAPPSDRAWGSVIRKAAKNGLIIHCGYKNVNNAKAHRTPASLWMPNFKERK